MLLGYNDNFSILKELQGKYLYRKMSNFFNNTVTLPHFANNPIF